VLDTSGVNLAKEPSARIKGNTRLDGSHSAVKAVDGVNGTGFYSSSAGAADNQGLQLDLGHEVPVSSIAAVYYGLRNVSDAASILCYSLLWQDAELGVLQENWFRIPADAYTFLPGAGDAPAGSPAAPAGPPSGSPPPQQPLLHSLSPPGEPPLVPLQPPAVPGTPPQTPAASGEPQASSPEPAEPDGTAGGCSTRSVAAASTRHESYSQLEVQSHTSRSQQCVASAMGT
jgi:hypothetical protein